MNLIRIWFIIIVQFVTSNIKLNYLNVSNTIDICVLSMTCKFRAFFQLFLNKVSVLIISQF